MSIGFQWMDWRFVALLMIAAFVWSGYELWKAGRSVPTWGWQDALSIPNKPGLYERDYSNEDWSSEANPYDYWDGKHWRYNSPGGDICISLRDWKYPL